jgi:hypothetical protein
MTQAIVGSSVGFDVGLRGLPDMDRLRRNNDLDRDCRECRVFLTEETVQGLQNCIPGLE